MAQIVYVSPNNRNGAEVMQAIQQIRRGFGTLRELDGLRAESIAVSAQQMADNFGITDAAQAQALSDRWDTVITALDEAAAASSFRDLLNAVTYTP